MRFIKGFSVMELMVAVVIAAILAGIAVSSYQSYLRKSYRSEAMQTLLSMQLAEERFRSTNVNYGNLSQIMGSTTTTASGRYTLSVLNNTATTYTVRATPTGSQASDAEDGTPCSPLEIIVNGATETRMPTLCWSS